MATDITIVPRKSADAPDMNSKRLLIIIVALAAAVAAFAEVSVSRIDATLREYANGEIDDIAIGNLVAVEDSLDREIVLSRFQKAGQKSLDVVLLGAALMHNWGMYERALESYSLIAARGEADSDTYYWYADAAGRVQGADAAYAVYGLALHKYPDDFNLKLGYAQTAIACAKYEEAVAVLDSLIERYPDNDQLYRDKIKALESLRKSLGR